MAKIFKFPSIPKSEKFMDNVSPNHIAEYLALQNPEAPPRVLSAMALAMIYSTHLSIVCEEENYCIKDLFDEDINLAIYDEKKNPLKSKKLKLIFLIRKYLLNGMMLTLVLVGLI
jgi:hypothetical protein